MAASAAACSASPPTLAARRYHSTALVYWAAAEASSSRRPPAAGSSSAASPAPPRPRAPCTSRPASASALLRCILAHLRACEASKLAASSRADRASAAIPMRSSLRAHRAHPLAASAAACSASPPTLAARRYHSTALAYWAAATAEEASPAEPGSAASPAAASAPSVSRSPPCRASASALLRCMWAHLSACESSSLAAASMADRASAAIPMRSSLPAHRAHSRAASAGATACRYHSTALAYWAATAAASTAGPRLPSASPPPSRIRCASASPRPWCIRAHSSACEASSLAAASMADRASPGRPADPRAWAHRARPAAHSPRRRGIALAVLSYCDEARPHCPSCSSALPAPSAARSLPGSISRAPPYHSAALPDLPRPSSMSPIWTRRAARLLPSPPAASSTALYGPSRSAPGGSCNAPPTRASQHLMHSEARFDLRFLRFFSLWASRGAPAPPSSPSA